MSDDNGTKPATPKAEASDAIPVSERIMGAFGLLVAIGLAVIALDLLLGGSLFGGTAGDNDG
jgi:hypothetical protein